MHQPFGRVFHVKKSVPYGHKPYQNDRSRLAFSSGQSGPYLIDVHQGVPSVACLEVEALLARQVALQAPCQGIPIGRALALAQALPWVNFRLTC